MVTELQPITAIFTIPEDNIPAVMAHIQNKEKLAAEAWDRDNKNQLANGVLTAIDNQVDPTTGTVKFRAEFPNLDNKLFPSQFINIKLRLETKKNAVLIPAASVQHGKSGAFVYLVQDDKTVKVQNVTLGVSENDLVLVEQGLKAGDILVIDGSDNLRDGSRVIADKTDAKLDGKTDKKTDGKVDNKSSDNSEHKNKNTTKSN